MEISKTATTTTLQHYKIPQQQQQQHYYYYYYNTGIQLTLLQNQQHYNTCISFQRDD